MGLKFQPDQFSTVFWDVFGEQGHAVRATVTEMGPLLLARMLDLNDVQEGVLNVAFRVADEAGLTLLDMKDLRALLDAIVPAGGKSDDADPLADIRKAAQGFGNVTKATVGTIQRQLLVLENQGGDKFFGEPAMALKDLMRTDRDGSMRRSFYGCCRSCSRNCLRSATCRNRNWCSSSTRRTCCSPMRRSP